MANTGATAEEKRIATAMRDVLNEMFGDINDTTERAIFGRFYEKVVGYNPFEDDPSQTVAEVSELLVGVMGEAIRAEADASKENMTQAAMNMQIATIWNLTHGKQGQAVELTGSPSDWAFWQRLYRA